MESLAIVSANSSSNLFILHRGHSSSSPNPHGLKANQASVELNQSAFLLMTSCLQLDSVPGRVGRLGPGPWAWKGALPPLPPPCSPRDLRAKGPLSATTSGETKACPKPLAGNYSQLIQNAHKARVPALHPFPTCLIFMKADYKTNLSLKPSAKF